MPTPFTTTENVEKQSKHHSSNSSAGSSTPSSSSSSTDGLDPDFFHPIFYHAWLVACHAFLFAGLYLWEILVDDQTLLCYQWTPLKISSIFSYVSLILLLLLWSAQFATITGILYIAALLGFRPTQRVGRCAKVGGFVFGMVARSFVIRALMPNHVVCGLARPVAEVVLEEQELDAAARKFVKDVLLKAMVKSGWCWLGRDGSVMYSTGEMRQEF
ncbi:hypothetical protein K402DRAFT_403713 [Aulographum hederae CBS 113979]|uniref:Uncharacterized protein n=1 Tax=Aulographum hederae CBS 113979 TaxID=1176131 RepID=A0A6G1H292_9PEZI|nr:hypothetical protein K402DRAFT_403713 [Aulographum hederae CBS 113979]